MKKAILLFVVMLLAACGGKPDFMEYEMIFYTELGEEVGQVGSNIPMLKDLIADNETYLLGDYLDSADSFQVFRDEVYISDKYNQRIDVFDMEEEETNYIIPNQGYGYAFDTNFQISLNKYGEMFVVADQTNTVSNEMYAVYYVYKFTSDGKFIYRLGEEGVNSEAMEYPVRIDTDLFNNLYVYHFAYEDGLGTWTVKRFSTSGELTFEFNSSYIALTNVVGNEKYLGRVTDVFNFKNDEQLLIYSTHRVIERDGVTVTTSDKFYNSLDVYSILKNSITENVLTDTENIEGILGVTQDDEIVMYGYDEELEAIRFRFIKIYEEEESERERIFYAPIFSAYYVNLGFYMDSKGDIYSILVKDYNYYIILHWIIPQNTSA